MGLVCPMFCENPFFDRRTKGCLCHTTPHFMAYFGAYFLQICEWGLSNCFTLSQKFYNGSEVLQGQNRQTIDLAQSWLKMGFSSLAGSGPKAGPKWLSGPILCRKRPRNPLGPTCGPLPGNDENIFLTHFCAQLIV